MILFRKWSLAPRQRGASLSAMPAPPHRRSGPALLLRPRLMGALNAPWKVALLTAPAGCGKSTLALQCSAGRSALWCRIHPEDADPFRLFSRLLAAGNALRPPVGRRTLQLFESRRDPERDDALLTGTFLSELESRHGETLLVLDDIHQLAGAHTALRWLSRLISETGPRVRFLLTCRGECPISLARIPLQGGLVSLDAAELAFTPAEERRFLRGMLGAANTRRAEDVTRPLQGWAAGLALAARSLARTAGAKVRTPAKPGSGEAQAPILEFLSTEVYRPLPPRLQRALSRAAVLEDLEPALVRVLLGTREARYLLEEIRRRDLFVQTLPDGGEGGRFHPLFREYLLGRLRKEQGEASWKEMHVRLARHWLAGDEPARAARLLSDAGASDQALRAFEVAASNSPAGETRGLGAAARTLFEMDPAPGRKSPWLGFHLAEDARERGRHEDAIRLSREAQAGFMERGDWALAARAFRLECQAAMETGRLLPSLSRGRAMLARVPPGCRAERGLFARHLGFLSLYSGKSAGARRWLSEAYELLKGPGRAVDRAEAFVLLATVDYTEGRWDKYLRAASAALPVFRGAGYARRVMALLLNMSEACIYLGEEARALAYLDEVRSTHSTRPSPGDQAIEAVLRARAYSETGAWAEARKQFARARAAVRESGSKIRELEWLVWAGILARRLGQSARAEDLLGRAEAGFADADSPSWLNLVRMEMALVWGLRGDPARALKSLAAARHHSRGDRKELARNFLFEARVRQAAGTPHGEPLTRSLRILDREDYLVLLRKEADIARPLLANAGESKGDLWVRALAALPAFPRAAASRRVAGRAAHPGAAAAGAIHLRLLGGFHLMVGGREIPMTRRSSQALLALLALRRGTPVRRETLTEQLWPEVEQAPARNRFDVALNAARAAVEPGAPPRGPYRVLLAEAGMCRLGAEGLTTDVGEFERLARECEPAVLRSGSNFPDPGEDPPLRDLLGDLRKLEAATGAYQGDLLPGTPWERWLQAERDRLRAIRHRLLLALGRLSLRMRRPGRAVDAAAAVLETDPLREDAVQLLMRGLAATGRRPQALQAFREFRARLRRELAAAPDPRTAALHDELVRE